MTIRLCRERHCLISGGGERGKEYKNVTRKRGKGHKSVTRKKGKGYKNITMVKKNYRAYKKNNNKIIIYIVSELCTYLTHTRRTDALSLRGDVDEESRLE